MQSLLHKQPKPQPQPQVTHIPLARGHRKFVFTKSSSVLPKQHAQQEFTSIINTKKTYQSLIKQQLRKLQSLETCVPDPEVQPFAMDGEGEGKKRDYQIQVGKKKGEQREKRDEVQLYLDGEISARNMKLLEKVVIKFKQRKFYHNLKYNLKSSKQRKAAQYFFYQKTLKKYFLTLKQAPTESSHTTSSYLQLSKQLYKNNFLSFLSRLQCSQLENRLKVYRKTKQYRAKKQTLQFLIRRYGVLIGKDQVLGTRRKGSLGDWVAKWRTVKAVQSLGEMVERVRKHRSLLRFIKSVEIDRQLVRLKEVLHSSGNPTLISKQLQMKFKSALPIQIQTAFKTKLAENNHRKSLQTSLRLSSMKQFVKLLKINYSSTLLYSKMEGESGKLSDLRIKEVFTVLRERLEERGKVERVRRLFLRKYLDSLMDNLKEDHRYSTSLGQCLKGSKEWLIKNKHIFKSQPLDPISKPSPVLSNFTHPLSSKTPKQLLPLQSKFKKTRELHLKNLFIHALQGRHRLGKKIGLMREAHQILDARRLMGLAFGVLRDKGEMRKIMGEIMEEMEVEADREMADKREETARALLTLAKKQLFSKLSHNHRTKADTIYLKTLLSRKKSKWFLDQLKRNQKRKQSNDELQTKLNVCKVIAIANRFHKLVTLLNQNREANQTTRLTQKCMAHRAKTNKQSLIGLLQIHQKITQSSISTTTLYLHNRLQSLTATNLLLTARKAVHAKAELLQRRRRAALLAYYLGRFRMQSGRNRGIKGKKEELRDRGRAKACRRVIRGLMGLSIDWKIGQDCRGNKHRLEQERKRNLVTDFINKLRKNARRQKQLKASPIRIPQEKPSETKNKSPQNMEGESKQRQQTPSPRPISSPSPSPSPNQNMAREEKKIEDLLFSDEKQQISYEEYRRSLLNHHEEGTPMQQEEQQVEEQDRSIQQDSGHEGKDYQQEQQEMELEGDQSGDSQGRSGPGRLQQSIREDSQKNIDPRIPQSQSSPYKQQSQSQSSAQEQSLGSPQKQPQTPNQSSMLSYNPAYLQNRYHTSLVTKFFSAWKAAHRSNTLNTSTLPNAGRQAGEPSSGKRVSLEAIFIGWRAYSQHKGLVRKYLREYEQDYHYYPQSRGEYQEFVDLAGKS